MEPTAANVTPYDDSFPVCESTHCELVIVVGANAVEDSEAVTGLLRLPPASLDKTAFGASGAGAARVDRAWVFSSAPAAASRDLRRHIDWTLEVFEDRVRELEDVRQWLDASVFLFCPFLSKGGFVGGGPILGPEQMARLAQLDLEVIFDVTFVPEDDPEDERE